MAFGPADALPICMKSPLFAGIEEAGVRAIVAAARRRRYSVHQIIFQSAEPSTHFFLLVSGFARLYGGTGKRRRLLVRWLGPGTAFGLQTLGQKKRAFEVDAEMVQTGDVLVWNRETIQQLALRYPAIFANALTMTMDYLAQYHSIHTGLASHTAEQRLAQALFDLSGSLGREHPSGVEIEVKNKHLADMASVTSFTASRILSSWHRRGFIEKSRGRIVLRSRERLSALIA